MENELAKKKEEMRVSGAEQVLTGPEFKKYIGMIRNKGNVYKTKRAEVSSFDFKVLHRSYTGFHFLEMVGTYVSQKIDTKIYFNF